MLLVQRIFTRSPLTLICTLQVGKQMMAVGVAIEDHFGKEPQDIEGGLVSGAAGKDTRVVIFQTRPQL